MARCFERFYRLAPLAVTSAMLATGCLVSTQVTPPGPAGAHRAPASDAPKSAPSRTQTQARAHFSPNERQRITQVEPWVEASARQHKIDPDLINGVIWVESRFQPRAKSHAGARGLMQLMPATAAAMARAMGQTRARSYDPEFNIAAGSLYLAKLLRKYEGHEQRAIAAYNAGSGNVDKWLARDGELPPRSKQYVALVQDARARFAAVRHARRDDTVVAQSRVARPRPPQPPAYVPEVPLRYDLDQVQTAYKPQVDPEPPLPTEPDRRQGQPTRTGPAGSAATSEAPSPPPTPAQGLPSVLD